MRGTSSRRNLALIRKTGSTSRILNLLVTSERFSENDAYKNNPLFKNKRLNRTIIVKHNLRGSEGDVFQERRTSATKIIWPFAAEDLSIGGASFFFEQNNYQAAMTDLLGGFDSSTDQQRDLETLRIIDQLPSLDPFLVRESLKKVGREPARCYFDLSEADVERMAAYVSSEIGKLVELAFAGSGKMNQELASQLASKLLSDENTESLMPLRYTLQLSGDEYSEGIFAWKGFLYYKWSFQELQLKIARVQREIKAVRFARADLETEAFLNQSRARIVAQFDVLLAQVRNALSTYDRAFADLTDKARPMAFRQFLLNSPAMFVEIGRKLGILTHIATFWRYRLPEGSAPRIEADEALDLFQEFESSLGTGGSAARSQHVWT